MRLPGRAGCRMQSHQRPLCVLSVAPTLLSPLPLSVRENPPAPRVGPASQCRLWRPSPSRPPLAASDNGLCPSVPGRELDSRRPLPHSTRERGRRGCSQRGDSRRAASPSPGQARPGSQKQGHTLGTLPESAGEPRLRRPPPASTWVPARRAPGRRRGASPCSLPGDGGWTHGRRTALSGEDAREAPGNVS